jgi:hypothetical protein
MKIVFNFGFNGGQLHAECASFEEVDKVIEYALHRGIIKMVVTDPKTGTQADVSITAREDIAPKTTERVVRAYTKGEVMADEVAPVSPANAAQAVKDFAAKHGVEAGRELLARFNLKRTNEITDANAAEVFAAATVTA